MTQLGNSPLQPTMLRLQARKSFALGLWIQDKNENPLSIEGTTISIVMRKKVSNGVSDDSGNLITNSIANLTSPTLGYAVFNLQASDLDHPVSTYIYSITLLDEGYSSTIVWGEIELEQNPEFGSVDDVYTPGGTATALRVILRENTAIRVLTGPTLAPNEATFTHDLEQKLLELYAGALAEGMVLTADWIPDGVAKVIMTVAERAKLLGLTNDWNDLINLPDFGDIITHDVSEFLLPLGVSGLDITTGEVNKAHLPKLSEHRGFAFGEAVPTLMEDGDMYFQYEA
jgi:hypothetical protein